MSDQIFLHVPSRVAKDVAPSISVDTAAASPSENLSVVPCFRRVSRGNAARRSSQTTQALLPSPVSMSAAILSVSSSGLLIPQPFGDGKQRPVHRERSAGQGTPRRRAVEETSSARPGVASGGASDATETSSTVVRECVGSSRGQTETGRMETKKRPKQRKIRKSILFLGDRCNVLERN